jgi:DNA modification methylase
MPPEQSNSKRCHPAQFPEQLANDHILSWSNEGETVLDPFMGSGTTAIACINTNRNYIGFELDKQYFDIANERIQKADGRRKRNYRGCIVLIKPPTRSGKPSGIKNQTAEERKR